MIFAQYLMCGKRFMVTGASGGAGGATARLLAQLGANVTVVGRDKGKLLALVASMKNLSSVAHDISIIDFSSAEAVTFGEPYDGIFHAAGQELIAPTGTIHENKVAEAFDASVGAAIFLARAIGRRKSILKDGGSVVMMSSVAATCGSAGLSVYGATKGAIESLVKNVAIEWAPRKIRVNAIRAGGFHSPMHDRIINSMPCGSYNDYLARHPLGFGTCEDIASMAVYLLSDAGRWVTGAALTVDGGYSCR